MLRGRSAVNARDGETLRDSGAHRRRGLEVFGDDRFDGADDLVECHGRGVNEDSIGGGLQGRIGPVAVALIAGAQVAQDFFRLDGGRGAKLIKAALTTDLGSCVQKDLDVGVWEDDCADVAAFHHDSAGSPHLLLQADHPRTHQRMDADAGGCVSDLRIADEAGYIFLIKQDAIFVLTGLQANCGFVGEGVESSGVVKRDFAAQGLEGEGAVHGACFKVEQAKVARQMACNGAFARAGRTVDGDDNPAGGLIGVEG